MSIRQRTLLFIGLTIAVLIAILLVFSQSILTNSYIALETDSVRQNLQRVRNAFNNEIDVINALTRDWTNWDTAYEFGNDGNQDFIESELDDDIIGNIGMNAVIFINTIREPLYAAVYNVEEGASQPMSDSMYAPLSMLMLDESLPPTEVVSGYFVLDGQPFIVSTKPLLPSRAEPPASGALLFGRTLDAEKIAQLNASLDLSFELFVVNENLPADIATAQSLIASGVPSVIVPVDDTTINGYLLIESLNESPDLAVRLTLPRDVYQQGQATIRAFFLFLVVTALLGSILIMMLIERTVLARLGQLSDQVESITAHNFTAARVQIAGKDELGKLAQDINDLLLRIDTADKTLGTSMKTIEQQTAQIRRTRELLSSTLDQVADAFKRGAHPDEINDYLIFARKQMQEHE